MANTEYESTNEVARNTQRKVTSQQGSERVTMSRHQLDYTIGREYPLPLHTDKRLHRLMAKPQLTSHW